MSRKIELTRERLMSDPKIYDALVNKIEEEYLEEGIVAGAYLLGNTIRHHANATDSEIKQVKESPFMDKITTYYGFQAFQHGFSLGHQHAIGQADPQYVKETDILMEDISRTMLNEAQNYFSNKKIVECFVAFLKGAFNKGVERGQNMGENEYFYVKK